MFSTMFWYETALQGLFMGLGYWAFQWTATLITTTILKAWRSIFITNYTWQQSTSDMPSLRTTNGAGPYTKTANGKRTPKTNDDYAAYTRERAKN